MLNNYYWYNDFNKRVSSPHFSAKNSMTNVMLKARHVKLQVTSERNTKEI